MNITAGTMRLRPISASSRTAMARPDPNSLITRSPPRMNEAKTRTMIAAAAVIVRPVTASPWPTACRLSRDRSHSSCMRLTRNTS